MEPDAVRTIKLPDGNKLNIKRNDPYGFWTIHFHAGQVPEHLRGQYTSIDIARREVDLYLEKRKTERPVLRRKPVKNA